MCKSAFFNLYFPKTSFESFTWIESSESCAFCLRIPAKSLNSLFRVSLHSGGDSGENASLSACKLVFAPQEVKFTISFWYAFGITKSTQVFYAEQNPTYPIHPPLEQLSHNFSCSSKSLVAWLGCLGTTGGKCEDLLLDFSNSNSVTLSAKAFGGGCGAEMGEREDSSFGGCTKLVIKHEQFNSVQISSSSCASQVCCWTTSFVEFKAFATLACALDESGALSVFWDDALECPVVCRAFGGRLVAVFAKNALQETGISNVEQAAIVSVIPTVSEPAGLSSDSESEEFIPSTPPKGKRFCE